MNERQTNLALPPLLQSKLASRVKNLIWIVGICGALAVVIAHASSSACICAGAISTNEATSRIGSSVKVEGTVSEVQISRGGAVFVELDGAYPDETFTAVRDTKLGTETMHRPPRDAQISHRTKNDVHQRARRGGAAVTPGALAH